MQTGTRRKDDKRYTHKEQIGDGAQVVNIKKKKKSAAVVILSGGVDSACVASMLKPEYNEMYGITFSYGQKAIREIKAAKYLAKKLELKQHKIIDISFMKNLYGDSNVLTGAKSTKIPNSFEYSIVVPIRNAVFLSIATAWAYSIGATRVAYGAHTGDTNYPDCRPRFAKKLQAAFNEGESDGIKSGSRREIDVWSPYVAGLTKEDLLKRATGKKGILGKGAIYKTWSCYASMELQCGVCESCVNRRRAFENAGIKDKTKYLAS